MPTIARRAHVVLMATGRSRTRAHGVRPDQERVWSASWVAGTAPWPIGTSATRTQSYTLYVVGAHGMRLRARRQPCAFHQRGDEMAAVALAERREDDGAMLPDPNRMTRQSNAAAGLPPITGSTPHHDRRGKHRRRLCLMVPQRPPSSASSPIGAPRTPPLSPASWS